MVSHWTDRSLPKLKVQYVAVSHRILCISATDAILQTRKLLVERHQYQVIPALNFREVEEACKRNKFGLALIGHDIEPKIKKAIGVKIREHRPDAPIVEMCRYSPELKGLSSPPPNLPGICCRPLPKFAPPRSRPQL